MQKYLKWISNEINKTEVELISKKYALSHIVAYLLSSRNISNEKEIHSYLNPKLSNLSDPLLLENVELAVSRIWKAKDKNENVLIFGDYDVDGICSSVIVTQVLRKLGINVDVFLPERLKDGYGLTINALNEILEKYDVNLLITVDCGTNSVDTINFAQSKDVDVIVTDHHEINHANTNNLTIVNPKLGNRRDLDVLCGAGVVFKLLHALLKSGRSNNREEAFGVDLKEILDLVALATIADVVPLKDENRILVYHGLEQLKKTKRKGISSLIKIITNDPQITTDFCGFQLGPRINAAGRISSPMLAFDLLISDNIEESETLAHELDDLNKTRKELEGLIFKDAVRKIDGKISSYKGLVVSDKTWHQGIVGIVASRISRHYNRPAIVLAEDSKGICKGSARGILGFELLNALTECEEFLEKYGGHSIAAGLQLHSKNFDIFREKFNEACTSRLKNEHFDNYLNIDKWLEDEVLDTHFFYDISKLAPFGESNKEPVFAISKAKLNQEPQKVGDSHLKFELIWNRQCLKAIAFNFSYLDIPNDSFDLAFTLNQNIWMGKKSLQLKVIAIRPS